MPDLTIPELTDEQRELVALQWRGKRRKEAMSIAPEPQPVNDRVRKLYLITIHSVALPDENGQAVYHSALYAWVETRSGESGPPFFGGCLAEVVAFANAKLLRVPVRLLVQSGALSGMVEVSPDLLHA